MSTTSVVIGSSAILSALAVAYNIRLKGSFWTEGFTPWEDVAFTTIVLLWMTIAFSFWGYIIVWIYQLGSHA
jgi:hypothetical protein